MKYLLITTILIATCSLTFGQGIEFKNTSWNEAVEYAAANNKSILVDGYTSWCKYCKLMDKEVFVEEEVGELYNDKFVSVKLDMEKGDGVGFAERYGVKSYPTFLFFSPNGELVHKVVGYRNPEQFVQDGQNAMDPEKSVFLIKKVYESGNRDPELLRRYTAALSAAGEDYADVAQAYINTLSDEQLNESGHMNFIYEYAHDVNSRGFDHFTNNLDAYTALLGEEKINIKTKHVSRSILQRALEEQDPGVIKNDLQKLYIKVDPEMAAEKQMHALMQYHEYNKDYEGYAKLANSYIEGYMMKRDLTESDGQELNAIAWTFYEKIEDPKRLESALKWVDQSLKLDVNYYNVDTKAALLFKLGYNEEAVKTAHEAIALAKKADLDPSETQKLIEKYSQE